MLPPSRIRLQEVDTRDYADLGFLYGVLIRRMDEPDNNLSHQRMPTWEQHVAFVQGEPYRAHYIINDMDSLLHVGVCYIGKQNEIGVWVSPEHRREGVASYAVREIMAQHPGPWLANINPKNRASVTLFIKLGFRFKDQDAIQLVLERP